MSKTVAKTIAKLKAKNYRLQLRLKEVKSYNLFLVFLSSLSFEVKQF